MVAQMPCEYLNDDSSFTKESLQKDPSSFFAKEKCIKFSFYDQHHFVLPLSEYTDTERENSWYTPKEIEYMSAEREKTIRRMEKGKSPKRTTSYRGLEYKTEIGYRVKESRRILCIDAVMDEQENQWDLGVFDWDQFAKISRKVSKKSSKLALKAAEKDELDALKAYARLLRKVTRKFI